METMRMRTMRRMRRIRRRTREDEDEYVGDEDDTIRITIWLFNIAMENPPIFKFGKPSINGPSIQWLC